MKTTKRTCKPYTGPQPQIQCPKECEGNAGHIIKDASVVALYIMAM